MAVQKFREGIGLVPTATDPASPVEGQLQYADGTARTEGLWFYSNGDWVQVGEKPPGDPKEIALENPRIEVNTTGWTIGGGSGSTFSVNTTDPISGEGDLDVVGQTWALSGADLDDLSIYDYIETDIDLEEQVNIGQKLRVALDMYTNALFQGPVPPVDHHFAIAVLDQATSTIIDSYKLYDDIRIIPQETHIHVDHTLDISSSSDTALKIRLYFCAHDKTNGLAGAPSQNFRVDNFKVTTETIETVGNSLNRERVKVIASYQGLGAVLRGDIPVDTIEIDNFGSLNAVVTSITSDDTCVFTAPVTAEYRISLSLRTDAETWVNGEDLYVIFLKNSTTPIGEDWFQAMNTGAYYASINISITKKLFAGETVKFEYTDNRSGGPVSVSAGKVHLSIEEVI